MEVDISHFSLLLILLYRVASGSQELSQQVCDEATRKCYYLYRDSNRLKLADAWQECIKKGQTLATIEDEVTQNIISKFVSNSNEELVQPWLAGKRSSDEMWRSLDGKQFQDLNYEVSTDFKCSAYTATLSNENNYYAVSCRIADVGTLQLRQQVCQMATINGVCPTGSEFVADSTCYAIPRNWTTTAFEANGICIKHYPGSVLAYRHIREKSFTDFVRDSYAANEEPDLWIGVYRKPWVWLPDELGRKEYIFKYSHWRKFSGVGDRGECVVIDIKNDKTWLDVSCSEPLLYFLCQGEKKVTDPPSQTTAVTFDPKAPSSTKQAISDTTIIIIASIAGGVLLFIVVILAIVISARRRRGRRTERSSPRRFQGETYNGESYQRSISPAPKLRHHSKNDVTALDSDRMSTMSVGVTKSSTDATNRELTPMDFNLLWSSVKERRASNISSNESHRQTTPDVLPESRSDRNNGIHYNNDGFLYENIDD